MHHKVKKKKASRLQCYNLYVSLNVPCCISFFLLFIGVHISIVSKAKVIISGLPYFNLANFDAVGPSNQQQIVVFPAQVAPVPGQIFSQGVFAGKEVGLAAYLSGLGLPRGLSMNVILDCVCVSKIFTPVSLAQAIKDLNADLLVNRLHSVLQSIVAYPFHFIA
jgi:hypothetical protein